ncbi:hypothetical protein Vadar_007480 [Vaccinium darrowii]|uniref:Uncharacterized protein n=1 Tax=Vaccinium darrowii TaxID=229202 RepID=A0ACB7ZI07_9ERIC|nr:hypothetical protein Vadar_007480 [Vaccinium darrowii]
MAIANKMRIYGDKLEDVTIVEKILRSMTTKFNFVICSIEESKEIDTLSIDELQNSLLVHEQKITQQDKEEQALKAAFNPRGAGRGKGEGKGKNAHQKPGEIRGADHYQGNGRGRDGQNSAGHNPKSADKSKVECYRCHSRDVVFDEEKTWSWDSTTADSQIPAVFDGADDETMQQPLQQLDPPYNQVPTATDTQSDSAATELEEQIVPASVSRPHRVRRSPAWMSDYESSEVDCRRNKKEGRSQTGANKKG